MSEVIERVKVTQLASIYEAHMGPMLEHLNKAFEHSKEITKAFRLTENRVQEDEQGQPAKVYSIPMSEGIPISQADEVKRRWKLAAWKVIYDFMDLAKYQNSRKQTQTYELFRDGKVSTCAPDEKPLTIDDFPDISEQAIIDVMLANAKTANEMLDEQIREEWDFWRPKSYHVTNREQWKVTPKIIQTYMLDEYSSWGGSFNVQYDKRAHVSKLDNLFHMLDGKGMISGKGPLLNKIESLDASNKIGETEYFRAYCFKNRNLHIHVKPKYKYLVDWFNQIGSGEGSTLYHYEEHKENPLDRMPRGQKMADLQWFPTPEAGINRVIDLLDIRHYDDDDYKRLRILEPSAGEGALAYAMSARDHDIYAVEIDAKRAKSMNRSGLRVTEMDFLKMEPVAMFDRVAMNPPFSNNRDVYHVYHAAKFLKRGGILVSIMSNHWRTASDKASAAFREWLDEIGGEVFDNDPKLFAPATYVKTCTIRIRRRADADCNSIHLPMRDTSKVAPALNVHTGDVSKRPRITNSKPTPQPKPAEPPKPRAKATRQAAFSWD